MGGILSLFVLRDKILNSRKESRFFYGEKTKSCICFKRYAYWYEEKTVDVCIR